MRWLCIVDIVGGVACIINGVLLMQMEIDITSVAITGLGALGVAFGLAMVRHEQH